MLDLVKNKIIRVIDLVVIEKDEAGHHEAIEMHQLAPDLLDVFDPLEAEVSGIIQVEDIEIGSLPQYCWKNRSRYKDAITIDLDKI